MSPAFRRALGAASALPLLAIVVMRQDAIIDAIAGARGLEATALIAGSLALLFTGIGVALFFAWIAAGMEERPFTWKLGWVLALTLFGVVTAPAFWLLHIRRAPEAPARYASGA